jgi:hypothetical protein
VEALVSALHAGSTQPKTCRSCGHHDLDAVLDLGRLPLANALLTVEQLALPEDRFPLELYFCPRCALVQIGESLPPERLFSDYAYASSYSDTMVEHARVLVEALVDARRLGRQRRRPDVDDLRSAGGGGHAPGRDAMGRHPAHHVQRLGGTAVHEPFLPGVPECVDTPHGIAQS